MIKDRIESSLFFSKKVPISCTLKAAEQTYQNVLAETMLDDPPVRTVLNFNMQTQAQTNWCWSAVSTSTAKFYNQSSFWTQCNLANRAFNQSSCCQDGTTSLCNQEWYLDQALNLVGHLRQFIDGTSDHDTVKTEINNGNPIGVRIQWVQGGHFLNIYGYNQTSDWLMLYIADPWFGYSYLRFHQLVIGYQGVGSWSHTYYID